MTAHPSFMAYDRRDPLEVINHEEHLKLELRIFLVVLGLALLATILHFTVEPHLPKAEAALVDDKVLCSNPLTESREVGEYCWDLFQRGL